MKKRSFIDIWDKDNKAIKINKYNQHVYECVDKTNAKIEFSSTESGFNQSLYFINPDDCFRFLFGYVSQLKKDLRAARGQSSSESYVHLDFPLNKRDFTEEELEYLGFYKDNVLYADK